MMDTPHAVTAYIRVSTSEQSVRRQRGDLADDVARYGLAVGREFTDEGISASLYGTKVRTDYEALVAFISSGQADGQVIWLNDASRLSRNVESFGPLRKLCRLHRVRWWIKGRVYDLNRNDDLTAVTDMIVAAERESLHKSDMIRSGIRDQVREHRPHAAAPYGYRRDYDARSGKFVAQVAHPTTGPIVTEIATRYAGGEPPTVIAADLAARAVPTPGTLPWSYRTVVRLATSATYVGRRRYRGKQHELAGTHAGGWPGLVDEETHMIALTRANEAGKKRRTQRRAENLLVGVAHCWRCPRNEPAPIGYVRAVDRDGRRVYGCLQGCFRLTQSDVDELVLEHLAALFLREDFAAVFTAGDTAEIVAARAGLAAAERAWEELATADISPAMLARREPPLLADIERAKAALDGLMQSSTAGRMLGHVPAADRMAAFVTFGLGVQRRIVAELLDITLAAVGGRGGRNRPVDEFVTILPLG